MSILSIEHLLHDHRQCEEILPGLTSLLDSLEADPRWTTAKRETLSRVHRFFEDVVIGHIAKEDKVLLPALEAYLPRNVGPLAVLRAEHVDIRENFRRLCASGQSFVDGENPPELLEEFRRTGRRLLEIVRDHIYKEDRVLFPMVTRFLSSERDTNLLEQMLALEAEEPPSH